VPLGNCPGGIRYIPVTDFPMLTMVGDPPEIGNPTTPAVILSGAVSAELAHAAGRYAGPPGGAPAVMLVNEFAGSGGDGRAAEPCA